MKRILISIITILSLLLSQAGSLLSAEAGLNTSAQATSLNASIQAPNLVPLLDLDQDGLPNSVETTGWYNLAGGPYRTNMNEADTDKDGLTDAEEKLFNTIPTDLTSPGISVKYQTAFKTFQYYNATDPAYLAMVQGGNQYLLTEGAVIRRGTTFKISAPNTGTAALSIRGKAGMTALTPVRDPARGGWNITVPAQGTVGVYTATITSGAWSQDLPIYVIFELPTGLTQAEINVYLYDDDPINKRDEVAVWWRAVDWKYYNSDSETPTPCDPADPICSDWQYHTISGYAQAFWTEQFTKNVLINYAIPAINGANNPYSASAAIGRQADAAVRINFSSIKNSFSSATRTFYDPTGHPLAPYSQNGGACETTAGVHNAMLRSAGIASRPFAIDYNKTLGHGEDGNFGIFEYDTAVMMWVRGPGVASNRWYAERSFNGAEDEYQSTPVWTSGTTGLRLLKDVGIYDPVNTARQFKHFQDRSSDAIQAANAGWDFQNGSAGGGMVNTSWTGTDIPQSEFDNYVVNRDFKWNSKYPLAILQSPFIDVLNCQVWKGDGWAPSEWMNPAVSLPEGRDEAHTYYLRPGVPSSPTSVENWPYNPEPTSCSASTTAEACEAFKAAWQAVCAPLPGQTFTSEPSPAVQPAQPVTSAVNTSVQLGNVLSSDGLDQNGDGRFDQLVVSFEITSAQAGEYQLGGWLRAGSKLIRADASWVTLEAGLQTVQIAFDGQQIGDNQISGPYQVETIWAAPADQAVSELPLPEEMAAYQTYSYTSQPYEASAFSVQAASIPGDYSYIGAANANGVVDKITISVPLNIALPGTFTVEADLYDGQARFVGQAVWTGSGPVASLDYAVSGTVAPYSLEHLRLMDASGRELAAFYAPVYTIQDLGSTTDSANAVQVSSPSGLTPVSSNLPEAFSVTPLDSDGNTLYDQLVVATTLNVTVAGSYWMEGLLVDEYNLPIAWSTSDPTQLSVGVNQTIQAAFDGKILFNQLPLKGSRSYTLVAVKIFSGSPAQATLVANIPISGLTTPLYTRVQFERPTTATNLFQDDIESGATKWTVPVTTQWSRPNNTTWHSYSHTWMANGTNVDGLLALATPLKFTGYGNPWLMFSTAYQLSAGQSFKVEVSTDGTQWTAVKTYTGSTAYWSTEVIDLSAYAHAASLRIRFNAPTSSGSFWYVDDVYVYGANTYYAVYQPLVMMQR